MDRRDILKSLTILPFAGSILPLESVLGGPKGTAATGPNIYQSIGVEPVINCVGTYTIIGGSLERPEVVAAMHSAAGFFVQYDELAFGVGQKLADLTGAEWGMVSAGCAAGIKHVTAACVTGGNPEKLIRIPDLSGFDKTEVVIPRSSRNAYDHGIRNIGVRIITVDTIEELDRALCSRTAMVYLMASDETDPGQPFSLEEVAARAKKWNVPVLIDAAAEDLTIPNVHLQRGASVVAYSGGKALCGPQCAGLVLGKKEILLSAWQASSPHHGPGRDNKVGKEEMLGMLAAVQSWVTRDHVEKMKTWHTYLENVAKKLSPIPGVKCTIEEPRGLSNHSPSLVISWNPDDLKIYGTDVQESLATNQPRIAVHSEYLDEAGNTAVIISSGQMQPGNDKAVADRIFEILSQPRVQPKEMSAPATDLTGRWDVNIEFFSSKSQHTFFLEQDGNWIKGSHKGEFSTRDIAGILDGDQVKLSSSDKHVADHIPFIFYGSAENGKMKGEIFMGEYIRAKFTAVRHEQKISHKPIRVPKGQPLAT
jgi:D-glucosaminate-6-phosphate ammonia-lyase